MWCSGMGWWGGLMMIAVWGGIIALVVWAVRSATSRPRDGSDPREVLARRYAAGEIGREEFEERRRVLGGS